MALKVKFRTLFPAQVQVNSPILLTKIGTSYTFSFDSNAAFSAATLTDITLINPIISGALTVTSSSSSALAVGRNGATNPTLQVDSSTASAATGWRMFGNAAGAAVGMSVISSGTNETGAINAKGSGAVVIGNGSTGGVQLGGGGGGVSVLSALTYGGVTLSNTVTGTGSMVLSSSPTLTTPVISGAIAGAVAISSNSASGLAVGSNGATNPVLQVNCSAGSQATGIQIVGNAAAGGVGIGAISSGTNESFAINAKGSGSIVLGNTSTGPINLSQAVTMSGALTYGGVTLSNAVTGTGSMALSISPTFTGAPLAPTAAVDTNTTQIATTAMVLGQAASATPGAITNTAAVGTSTRYARADHVHAFESTAWTTYTPTITAGAGTFTTVSATGRYKQIGKTVFVSVDVTITTAGTAASTLFASLPLTAAAASYTGSAIEVTGGKSGAVRIAPSATTMGTLDATAATFIANGKEVVMTSVYEIP